MEWVGDFWEWAWARHANELSWYIRPLFLVPFMYFAYRRSWLGIGATLLALLTSMFWFPAPANPDPQILSFLQAERDYLTTGWTVGKVALSLLVPASMGALGLALWRRSLGWGLVVLNAIAVAKVAWSVVYDDGGVAVVAPALIGLLATDAALLGAVAWLRSRRTRRPSQDAGTQPRHADTGPVAAG